MNGPILEAERDNPDALVATVHDQVESEVLNEVIAVVPETLAVERVQQRVTSTVSDTAASVTKQATTIQYHSHTLRTI